MARLSSNKCEVKQRQVAPVDGFPLDTAETPDSAPVSVSVPVFVLWLHVLSASSAHATLLCLYVYVCVCSLVPRPVRLPALHIIHICIYCQKTALAVT